jgi:hypothetical protein
MQDLKVEALMKRSVFKGPCIHEKKKYVIINFYCQPDDVRCVRGTNISISFLLLSFLVADLGTAQK